MGKDLESQLLHKLRGLRLVLEMEDSWVWKDGVFLTYSVKSVYVSLRGDSKGESSSMYERFWRIKALPLAHVTTWRVLENKIVTKVNLERRGVVVESILCSFMGVEEDSCRHFFLSSE